jgi:hypothetical protein
MPIYGTDGSILTGEAAGIRRGAKIDGYALPNGCIISAKLSRDLHNRIKNDSRLRERIEGAQKLVHARRVQRWIAGGMVGKKPLMMETIQMAMLRHDNKEMNTDVRNAIDKNMAFGEKIQQQKKDERKVA